MKQPTFEFMLPVSTREDREERMAFVHRAKRPGKTLAQTRSNDRRKAINESRKDA